MTVVSERAKYQEIWAVDAYRAHSPGLTNVERFIRIVAPAKHAELIDLGCGTGDAGVEFERRELAVTWLDITDCALNPLIDRRRFIEAALWQDWACGQRWDYGFCCDVMEHIPTEYVMLAIERIMSACRVAAYFAIALRPDQFGAAIGQPLHLTVREFAWWRDHFAEMGCLVEARDLCGDGLFICCNRD